MDLERQVIFRTNGAQIPFEIDPFNKERLLLGKKITHLQEQALKAVANAAGLDDIGLTLQDEEKISSYEAIRAAKRPWL